MGLKCLIVLTYYNRPNLVHNALHSIRMLDYDNFEVAVIDDGGEVRLSEIVHAHYVDIADKFTFYCIEDSDEQKVTQGGSRLGTFINKAVQTHHADFFVILSDDDALTPNGLSDASKWFVDNPNKFYGYGHAIDFHPYKKRFWDVPKDGRNNHTHSLNGSCQLGLSQGVFRTFPIKTGRVRFSDYLTTCMGAKFYAAMHVIYGDCHFMGFFIQYKARFEMQLSIRGKPFGRTE